MHRATAVFATSALTVLGAGCSFAMRPVRVDASPLDWDRLSGTWRGQYTVSGQERHGVIEFRLDARAHEAVGDVLLIAPRGWRATGMPPSHTMPRYPGAETQLLSIRFLAADQGLVRGDLEPYWDPDRECRATAVFSGSVDGDIIAGSFVSSCEGGLRMLRGSWRIERTRAP